MYKSGQICLEEYMAIHLAPTTIEANTDPERASDDHIEINLWSTIPHTHPKDCLAAGTKADAVDTTATRHKVVFIIMLM